jgi:CDP-diacylglycerol--glycerol-3-phosphate 3-phosphatidyltransferase
MFLPFPIGQTLAPAPFWFWLGWLVMGTAFALTVITGVMYVFDALRLRRQSGGGPKTDAS